MNVSKYLLSTLLLSIFLFVACDESEDVGVYEQEVLTTANNPLTYTNLTSYPIVGPITSAVPAGNFDTPFRYRLLNSASTTGSSFTKAAFTVNGDTGTVAYGNAGNTITPGTYSVDIGVTNSNGMAVYEGAYELTILEVPVEVSIDAAQVNAGIFEQGVMATVSYTDTSASGSDVTSVSYALIDPPAGFTINATTGAISKVNGAISGPNQLSIRVTTNAGIIVVQNILTVVVGAPPTLQMVQQDGTTALTKAVVSPFTAYTTAAPVVDGMSPTQWEIVFPKSLVNSDPDAAAGETAIDFSSAFSVEDPSGKVSIAVDAGLPAGLHTLSLKATNASANEYTFVDVLTIEVEERWNTTPIYSASDFDAYTGVKLHHLDSPETFLATAAAHGMALMPVIKWQSINGNGNAARKDAAMELKIPITDSSVKKVRISFYEAVGYNNYYMTRHERKMYSLQTADAAAPAADPATWDLTLDSDYSSWTTINQWSQLKAARTAGTGPNINLFNKIDGVIIDLNAGIQNLYLFLRLTKISDTAPTQGQWLIADFTVEGSGAFTAEEY